MQIDWSLWNWALPWEVHRTDPHPGQCPCNSWEKGTLTLPSVEKGNRFQDLSQGAYHSTGHLVSVSAWNRPTVHWHSLKNCIYPHVMPSELPHTNSPSLNCFQAFCHLLLQAWPQWSLLHITCWSLQSSELKKNARVQTGMNSSLMWLCPVHCMLHWLQHRHTVLATDIL